jgi:hypothetical protein
LWRERRRRMKEFCEASFKCFFRFPVQFLPFLLSFSYSPHSIIFVSVQAFFIHESSVTRSKMSCLASSKTYIEEVLSCWRFYICILVHFLSLLFSIF